MFECIKTLKDSDDYKIVYFDDNGEIKSFENAILADSNNTYAYFKISDISMLLDGAQKIDDFHVIYKKDTLSYYVVKKDRKHVISIKNNIQKLEPRDNPTIVIDIIDSGFSFQLTKNILVETTLIAKLNQNFYITLLDEPDFIIDILNLNYEKLISGEKYTINYIHKYNDISMYITEEILETYSIEDKRVT
jgi:hypothetical protein